MARLSATLTLLAVATGVGTAHGVSLLRAKPEQEDGPLKTVKDIDEPFEEIFEPKIVKSEGSLRTRDQDWGEPFYDETLPSWEELHDQAGGYGHTCDPMHPIHKCGLKYVCRNKMCQSCHVDRECPSRYECRLDKDRGSTVCVPRGLSWDWNDITLSILVFFVAACSAAAGVGGGSVYVPMFLLLVGVHTHDAVPISQAMIFMTSIINLCVFVFQWHPIHPKKAKIDYNVAMLFQPNLTTGVVVGILVHQISPSWFITLCLIVTLFIALERTLLKGIRSWRAETIHNAAVERLGEATEDKRRSVRELASDFLQMQRSNSVAILLIWVVWIGVFFFNYMSPNTCSTAFWISVSVLVVGMGLVTIGVTWYLKRLKDVGENDWSLEGANSWSYPLVAFTAGFLGGFLGIGGGIVMSPVLLEIGLHASAVQATSALIVFLSSSTATLQFILLDKVLWSYVAYFGGIAVLGTIFGQTGLEYVVSHYRRPSLVVFSLALILALSAILMSVLGVVDAVNDHRDGHYMGFRPDALCH